MSVAAALSSTAHGLPVVRRDAAARVYDPGDRIFVFGFSRGAFTVRTLAGMIVRCGILNGSALPTTAALEEAVAETYAAYRVLGGYDSHLTRLFGTVLGRRDPEAVFATLRRDFEFHPPADLDSWGSGTRSTRWGCRLWGISSTDGSISSSSAP